MKLIINLLTVSRIFFGILIFYLLTNTNLYFYSIIFFLIGGFSDYLDGYLARKYNHTSELGEILDPISDKIFIIFVFFALSVYLTSTYVAFCASIIISRELLVSALRDFNSRKGLSGATKVMYIGKVKTTIQFFTILIYLIAISFNINLLLIVGDIFLLMTALVTLYSGYQYVSNTIDSVKIN